MGAWNWNGISNSCSTCNSCRMFARRGARINSDGSLVVTQCRRLRCAGPACALTSRGSLKPAMFASLSGGADGRAWQWRVRKGMPVGRGHAGAAYIAHRSMGQVSKGFDTPVEMPKLQGSRLPALLSTSHGGGKCKAPNML